MKDQKTSRWQTLAWLIVLSLLLVGVFDSIYLLDVHVTHKLGSNIDGFCDISETVNCLGAVDSMQSSLFGFAVPLYAIAFYMAMFVLTLVIGLRRRAHDPIWDLLIVGFIGGNCYSLYLLYILLFELDALCPGCLVLDAVNLAGLFFAFVAVGMGPVAVLKRSLSSLLSNSGALTIVIGLAVFAATFAAGLYGKDRLEQLRSSQQPAADLSPAVSAVSSVSCVCETIFRESEGLFRGAPVQGNPEASVVILEFSNFQCPYCARLAYTLKEILEDRSHEIQVRFFHYPLSNECNPHVAATGNPLSCVAARATVCAHEQGHFWELHDLLFVNMRQLSPETIWSMASSIGLNMGLFDQCMNSPHSLQIVEANASAGHVAMLEAGFEQFGTPFFFVNNMPVRGARPREVIEAVIDAVLDTVGNHVHEDRPQ